MDLCCIVIAFILADWFRHEAIINLYTDEIYRNTIIFIVLLDLCVSVVSESYKGVLKRGYYLEFNAVLKQTIIAELGTGLYLFSIDNGHNFFKNCAISYGNYLYRSYLSYTNSLEEAFEK